MKKILRLVVILLIGIQLASCEKESSISTSGVNEESQSNSDQRVYTGFPEGFEAGTKTTYSTADVLLGSGSWNFNDVVIGTSSSDRKSGSKSARIENTGLLSMNFDVTNGVLKVTVSHAKYGSDATSTWELDASTDGGSTWTKTGSTVTTSSKSLRTATFNLSYAGTVRFRINKLSGGKLNIDDFSISDNSTPTRDDNMAMGNPSGAINDALVLNNYLMVKTQYALSYNNSKGEANWVSWHLSTAWTGSASRCDCFASDNTLPSNFYKVGSTEYSGSGFDRGHQCPSADRNYSSTDNSVTFLMTNMIPQSPNLNQITWENLESYCRTLMNAGNELYIICGGYGTGGSGYYGGTTNSVGSGHVNVPAHCWKVVVVLPVGTDDVNRVSSSTRVIAVDMPNTQTVNSQSWGAYRVSVDALEAITGYDFLSNVPASIQSAIELAADNGPTQ